MKKKLISFIVMIAMVMSIMPYNVKAADLGKPEWVYFYFYADEGLAVCQVSKGPEGCRYQFHASALGQTKDSTARAYSENGFNYDVSNYTKYSGISVDLSMRYVTVDSNNNVVSGGAYSDSISVTMATSSGITAKDVDVAASSLVQTVQIEATTTGGNSLEYACLGSLKVDNSGVVTIPANYTGSEYIIITNVKNGKATTSKRIKLTVTKDGSHSHNYVVVSNTATCAKDGVATYQCSCGDTKTEPSKATGNHTYDNGVVTTEPTVDHDGYMTYTCTACGDTINTRLPALEKTEDPKEPEVAKPAKVKNVKITTLKTGLKVSYSKVEGADAYQIWRKGTSDKKYKKIATVEADTNKYTDKTAKNGKTYSYKVRAVKDGVTGSYSKVAKKTFLSAVKIKSVTSTKAGKANITIEKKNSKADYYQICYSNSKEFKKSKTVKATSLKKTITKLKSGKNVYVKVRAVKKVADDSTVYSAWSSVTKKKVK